MIRLIFLTRCIKMCREPVLRHHGWIALYHCKTWGHNTNMKWDHVHHSSLYKSVWCSKTGPKFLLRPSEVSLSCSCFYLSKSWAKTNRSKVFKPPKWTFGPEAYSTLMQPKPSDVCVVQTATQKRLSVSVSPHKPDARLTARLSRAAE